LPRTWKKRLVARGEARVEVLRVVVIVFEKLSVAKARVTSWDCLTLPVHCGHLQFGQWRKEWIDL
jgi:hypothetical protein